MGREGSVEWNMRGTAEANQKLSLIPIKRQQVCDGDRDTGGEEEGAEGGNEGGAARPIRS